MNVKNLCTKKIQSDLRAVRTTAGEAICARYEHSLPALVGIVLTYALHPFIATSLMTGL